MFVKKHRPYITNGPSQQLASVQHLERFFVDTSWTLEKMLKIQHSHLQEMRATLLPQVWTNDFHQRWSEKKLLLNWEPD